MNTVRWIDANLEPQVSAFFHANANTGLLQQVLCDQLNRGDQTAVPSAQSGDVREGVQKKNRFFLGNSPKQRTPPTHPYGLGLT